MSTQIQIRRDTTANWESVNPVLADGEIGYDTTANKFKVGNGTDAWQDIEYSGASGAPAVHVGDTAPADPVEGQQWLNTDDGYLYVYYNNAGDPTWMAVEREAVPDDDGEVAGDPSWAGVEFLLNGEDGLIDSSGRYTVTVHGGVEIATDVVKYGVGSVDTKQSGNYISVGSFTNLNVPFTVEAWVYQTSLRTGVVVANWQNVEYSWKLGTLSTGVLEATISHNGYEIPRNATIQTSDKMSPNRWHHVALSWDGAEYRLFLDGKSASKTYQSNNPPHISVQTDLTIGARVTAGSASEWIYGYIDDLRIPRGVCRYTEDFEPPAEHPVGLQRTVYLPAAPIETQEDGNDADIS